MELEMECCRAFLRPPRTFFYDVPTYPIFPPAPKVPKVNFDLNFQ